MAARSLAGLHGVTPGAVLGALPEAARRAKADREDPTPAIAPALAALLGAPEPEPDTIAYFHGTRLRDHRRVLERGLPPPGHDGLWDDLAALAPELSGADLRALRDGVGVTGDDRSRGRLVRDVLLRPAEYGCRDDLATPRVLADVGGLAQRRFGIDLRARYLERTVPCIVEFTCPAGDAAPALAAACWYLEAAQRGEAASRALASHDGAASVPAAAIVSIRAADGSEREWRKE